MRDADQFPVSEYRQMRGRYLAVIRSIRRPDLPRSTRQEVLRLHTGSNNAGRPSFGSWVTYGLGSENRNLPGFVVLSFGVVPCGGMENYSNGFLPADNQASLNNADGTPDRKTFYRRIRSQRVQLAKPGPACGETG